MNYISALAVVLGIFSGSLSLYEFIKKKSWRPGVACSIAAAILLVAALVVANLPTPSGSQASGVPPAQSSSTTSSGTGDTPISAQGAPTPAPTTPTSSIQPGDVLCQADAAHGWSGWNGTPDWKVLNGVLISNGTYNITEGPPTIVAPCPLGGTANYAVEATIQVLKNSYPTCFGIDVRGTPTENGWQGYVGTVYVACNNGNNLLAFNIDNMNNAYLISAPFSPGTGYHTYRVEAQDNQLRFLIDEAQILAVTDNTYTSGVQVGLWSYDAQLNVSSFKIIAL
jgi:hypothetical protein